MSTTDRTKVALFIDWDNLAISTAADLNGAVPDVRAIVQRAQQYGLVIIAKAYAEWQATSDRLAVYRAGVEPVYAPTFRFEPDFAGQPGKGKSLADPCMVADCIDALHLFPDITTYVLVTGDKDMIPVVRLAQLRGRRVVVIGPDYVAGVLREMTDDYVAYRSLVELTPTRPVEPTKRYTGHPAEEPARRRAGERHSATSAFARQEKLAAASPQLPAVPPAAPVPLQPVAAPTPAPQQATRQRTIEPVEAPAEAPEERGADDLRTVFSTITEILKQRSDEGRDRIRATNLKDALMQRMPGFSERRFGFAKFKDLLTAAERAGLIDVTMAGPVHWISLPGRPEAAETTKAPTEVTETAGEQPAAEPVSAEMPPAQLEDRRNEMIRFIHDLGGRSRWLTYTYVLTNLISHFGKSMPQTAAENEARDTLNYMVQQGVLHVDKEPQEVEVGGAKHRVRMCHLDSSHPLVSEALGFSPEEQVEQTVAGPKEGPIEGQPSHQEEPEPGEGAKTVEPEAPVWREELVAVESAPEVVATPEGEELQGADVVVAGNGAVAPVERVPEESQVPTEAATEGDAVPAEEQGAPSTEPERQEETTERAANIVPADESTAGSRDMALARAYATLERLIADVTSKEKPMISASSLRSRLVRALGSFNERQLGFPRFKEFLQAAQQQGIVRIITRGYVTWVTVPTGTEGQAPQAAKE